MFYLYKDYTGRQRKRNFIEFGEKKVNIGFFTKKYTEYDVIEEKSQWELFGSLTLPVYTGKEIRREYQGRIMNYTREQVKEIFQDKILKIMQTLEEKGVQIIEKNVTIKKGEKKWILEIRFMVVEQDGIEKETSVLQMEQTSQPEILEQ